MVNGRNTRKSRELYRLPYLTKNLTKFSFYSIYHLLSATYRKSGGEGEIRTPGTLTSTSDFESGAFNHSATSPLGRTGRFASLFSLTNGMECVISRTDAGVEIFRIRLGVSREKTSAPSPCSARPELRWSPRPDGSAWDDSALAAWSGPHRLSDPRRHRI